VGIIVILVIAFLFFSAKPAVEAIYESCGESPPTTLEKERASEKKIAKASNPDGEYFPEKKKRDKEKKKGGKNKSKCSGKPQKKSGSAPSSGPADTANNGEGMDVEDGTDDSGMIPIRLYIYLTELENQKVDVNVCNELASSFATELATVGKQLSELSKVVVKQQKMIVDQNAVLEKLIPRLSAPNSSPLALTGPNGALSATNASSSMALVPFTPLAPVAAAQPLTGLNYAPNFSLATPPADTLQNQLSEIFQVKQQLAFSQQFQALQTQQDLVVKVNLLEHKIQMQMMQGCPTQQQAQSRGS